VVWVRLFAILLVQCPFAIISVTHIPVSQVSYSKCSLPSCRVLFLRGTELLSRDGRSRPVQFLTLSGLINGLVPSPNGSDLSEAVGAVQDETVVMPVLCRQMHMAPLLHFVKLHIATDPALNALDAFFVCITIPVVFISLAGKRRGEGIQCNNLRDVDAFAGSLLLERK
jgi:hypothetical protein